MSLFKAELPNGYRWGRLGDFYEVTRKPRELRVPEKACVPFVPMELIPQGGAFEAKFVEKPSGSISSGTYIEHGDILIAKITPSFENGKQALAKNLPQSFGYATTEVIPLRPKSDHQDRRVLFYYLLHPEVRSYVAEKMEGSTGRQRVPESVLLDLPFPEIERGDQEGIANSLEFVQRAMEVERRSIKTCKHLKRTAMRELFTRGLRGEPRRLTEIGLVPNSWAVERLDRYADVISTRMAYSGLEAAVSSESPNATRVLGIKVSDMNLPGNEVLLHRSALQVQMDSALAARYAAPPFTILFPKRGAAIATNKKRLSLTWTIFDPNIIGVRGGPELDQWFLFQWFQNFDLRTITEPGPTPQLNKKNLDPLLIPVPPTLEEQREIVEVLDAIDRKVNIHGQKLGVLESLFRSLLHKLMTGEVRLADLDLSALETGRTAEVSA